MKLTYYCPGLSGPVRLLFVIVFFCTLSIAKAQTSGTTTFTWPKESRIQTQQELFTRSHTEVSLDIPLPGNPVQFSIQSKSFIKQADGTSDRSYQTFSGRNNQDHPVFGYFDGDQIYLSYFQNGEIITISPGKEPDHYTIGSSKDLEAMGAIQCAVNNTPDVEVRRGGSSVPCQTQSYSSLTYNLFVVCTGEWGQELGSISAARQAIMNNVNALNALYTGEMNISFNLVMDDDFIYTDPDSDPFDPAGVNRAEQARQFFVDSVNVSAFDIGHVLHYMDVPSGYISGSGVAYLPASCSAFYKGGGWTGTSSPGNTGFNLKIFGHEIGHQLGAHHTFYGSEGNCTARQRSNGHGFEPGSGSSLMSYEGNCGSHNLDGPRSPFLYFNTHSVNQILNRINGQSGCGTKLGNSTILPVTLPADFSIPKNTPFDLIATSPNNALSYTWEQYDTDGEVADDVRCHPINAGQYTTTPLYRSYAPSAEGRHRSFPSKDVQMSGSIEKGEVYATKARDITMRLTTRSGGNIQCEEMTVTVRDDPAFKILSPVQDDMIALSKSATRAAQNLTVLWETGDTETNGFTHVDIYYSLDGGQTYPYLLAEEVPNDGEHEVRPPEIDTDMARLKIVLTDGAERMAIYNQNQGNFTVGFSVTPLEIEQFDGAVFGNHHRLSWKLNNTGIPIQTVNMEYSYDGIHFTPVKVDGYELLNSESQWKSAYESYFTEGIKTFYRLAVHNIQNKITYSRVVSLNNETESAEFLHVYPNPVSTADLHLTFQKHLRPDADLSVWSINGKPLQKIHIHGRSKSLKIPFTYPAGVYVLKVTNGQEVYRHKVIVQNN